MHQPVTEAHKSSLALPRGFSDFRAAARRPRAVLALRVAIRRQRSALCRLTLHLHPAHSAIFTTDLRRQEDLHSAVYRSHSFPRHSHHLHERRFFTAFLVLLTTLSATDSVDGSSKPAPVT